MQTRIENGAGPRFTGLGVWNVYFIIAFALAAFGYIELNLLGNALLMAWLLLPVGPKWLRILRGTLGVAKDAAVGFKAIRLFFDVESDAPQDKLDTLLKLTERYCVVFQTLNVKPELSATLERNAS